MSFSRRGFLSGLVGVAAGAPFEALAAVAAEAVHPSNLQDPEAGYGPLYPVRDRATGLPLIELPRGFEYTTFGWTGDPLRDGEPTPPDHDGMAAFAGPEGQVVLVRNHEVARATGVFSKHAPVYDPLAGGGTTSLLFDPALGELRDAWASLCGTVANCAGGPTPWGSWLSCEEAFAGPPDDVWRSCTEDEDDPSKTTRAKFERAHGYVFEVPAEGPASVEPLRALGRFVHEAVAVDPATGVVYLTEDSSRAGLYRFVPQMPGKLAHGGRLEMLAVTREPGYDTTRGQSRAHIHEVQWVPIPDPDPERPEEDSVFRQGFARGGALFSRLEGAWFSNGRVYFTSTNGGDACQGQVWMLDPREGSLRLVFESIHAGVLGYPDNLTASPRGGLVLAEDGEGTEFLQGLTPDGRLFRFAQNRFVMGGEHGGLFGDFTGGEFAGPCFSPDGNWLFVNVQTPGVSVAITGPWERGPL